MSVRKILADLWVKLERETGEVPTRIDLPINTFERLLGEFKDTHLFEVPDGFTSGPMNAIVLTVAGQRLRVHMSPEKERADR